MTEETTTGGDELVTPEEHAEAYDELEAGQDVADPGVPADVEIASRSADMSSPSDTHEKVFVLGPGIGNPSKNPYTEANGYDHEPNKAATRQYAIDGGMWPTGDVAFKSAKRHPDGASWILTYTVPVIPAHDGLEGAQTPHVVDDDSDTENAINYSPPSEVDEHVDQTDGESKPAE